MTDNEIIKALECCIGDDEGRNCHLCPLYDVQNDCTRVVCKLALDLIKRQQAEIEELQRKNSELEFELKNAKSEIRRLRNGLMGECMLSACERENEIKSEAVKEFWEKVKEIFIGSDELDKTIDDLVKEMEVKI